VHDFVIKVESPTGAVTLAARRVVGVVFGHSLNAGWHGSVSCRRSSNRTCGTIASGSPPSLQTFALDRSLSRTGTLCKPSAP
jgi:hypothetical protein